jgi:hypothetical protein
MTMTTIATTRITGSRTSQRSSTLSFLTELT